MTHCFLQRQKLCPDLYKMSAGIKKQQYMPTYKDESGSETTLLSDDEGDNRYVSRPKRTTGFFTPTRLLCVVLVLQVAILSALAFFIIKKPKPIGPSQMTRGAPPGAEFNGLVPERRAYLESASVLNADNWCSAMGAQNDYKPNGHLHNGFHVGGKFPDDPSEVE